MRKYFTIGMLLTAGLILCMSEAGGTLATMGVKIAGCLCLGAVAYMTKGEEA